jgi:hypothetical protein
MTAKMQLMAITTQQWLDNAKLRSKFMFLDARKAIEVQCTDMLGKESTFEQAPVRLVPRPAQNAANRCVSTF